MAQETTEAIIVVCDGCGERLDPTPAKGQYWGGRRKKYHNDACRKRAERRKQREQALVTGTPVAPRKRTQSARAKALWKEAKFYVFDWKAEHYGPMLRQDAERVAALVGGQVFEADSFSAASNLYEKFLLSVAGQAWSARQAEAHRPKIESYGKGDKDGSRRTN